MISETTIGIIGGSGWLGRSIARAMLEQSFVGAQSLVLSSRNAGHSARWPGVTVTTDNQALVERCDVIILSVRPEQFSAIQINAHGKLVISLMAGLPLELIADRTHSQQVIRAMPNAAVEIGKSYSPWLAHPSVSPEQKILTQRLFETCGSADEVASESDLDYLSALVGTGPAYPALLAQAMLEHALARGLAPDIALRAVTAVVVDASQMLGAQRSFDDILQALIGYRGVTAAGLETMLANGFDQTITAGLDAAVLAAQAMKTLPLTAENTGCQ